MNTSTKAYFDIGIKILESRNISTPGENVSTQISVQVGDEKRYSKVIHKTTKPFFDDYFVFTKFASLHDLMDNLITITALRVRKRVRVRKVLGCISMDVATVWNQPGRRLKKWFALALPSDHSVQSNAFVECDLKIGSTREYHELLQLEWFESSEIVGSRSARYKVLVYHGTGLQVHETKHTDVTVRVLYAGKSGKTTKRKLGELVEWNESISFVELFPPMRQRLTLEVHVGNKKLVGKQFNIVDFFKIFHDGFLSMFGPTYVHLYADKYLYRGSLLISLESEILGQLKESEHIHGVRVTQIDPISQIKYGIIKTFFCFGVVFDLMITKAKCGKDNVYVSLEMGGITNIDSEKYTGISYDTNLYVPFDDQKPCISFTCEWPDCTHRLYNSNVLASLTDDLKEKLEISQLLTSKGCDDEAKNLLFSAFSEFRNKCKRVLEVLSKGITELDAKRTKFLKKKISLLTNFLTKDFDLDHITEVCTFLFDVLDSFCEDVQDSLPSLLITVNQGKTVIGSCWLPPRYLIFSEVKEKLGKNSAKINNLLFKGEDGDIVARMDIWLWLGKKEEIGKCKEHLPPGYKPFYLSEEKKGQSLLPSSLSYPYSNTYTAVCHVHSAFINEEGVSEGECDSFLRVCFHNQYRRTITYRRSLAPTWKETLLLPQIKLYSSPDYLLEHPPSLTIQLWNETANGPRLIGYRTIASPIRLQPLTKTPEFSLKWWKLGDRCEVLLACEIFQMSSKNKPGELFSMRRQNSIIPRLLDPPTTSYRLEVVFWGMRPSSVRGLKNLIQPQISIQLSTARLTSSVVARASTTFNFTRDTRIVSLQLPENKIYSPPLSIKVMSNVKYLTSITEKNIYRYEYKLPKKVQWDALSGRRASDRTTYTAGLSHRVAFPDLIPEEEVTTRQSTSMVTILEMPSRFKSLMRDFPFISKVFQSQTPDFGSPEGSSDEDELEQDWWDRYWSGQIQIYDDTLENQKIFSGFTDVLSTFTVKQRKDNCQVPSVDSTDMCKLKAIISLYKWPVNEPVVTMEGQDPEMGILKLSELNSRVNLLVRVYCVKANDLYPSDLSGKSDPYIEIATPSKTVSDKSNPILCELNPVFGNFLEINVTLPTDSLLAVRVMDWDALSMNDIIGETIIDIENRFCSKHRATCGLPETYSTAGPNAWRDIETPTEILERLCNAHNLPLPQYHEKSVTIGSKEFLTNKTVLDRVENQERLALLALNNWRKMPIVGRPLVAEHVETRLLFKEDRPGLVRGKITLWLDMFDISLGNIPLPRDISPRSPQGFELRVNILNTEKVPLVDVNLRERKCTDIMVKGWLGDSKQAQNTDVHHNSYTGSGNFNWRFVFPFLYYRKEKKLVSYKKNLLDIGKTEVKEPAVLHLELYDSEGLLEDTFIGGMMLELCRMPRGARSVKACKPEVVFDPANFVDLFKFESLTGWWPFLVDKRVMQDRGFLQAEIFLITAEEARKCPVGLGRSPPDPLPVPERARGGKSPWILFQDMIAKTNCQSHLEFSFNFIVILFLIVLIGLLVYILPSTLEKLRPWLDETF